MGLALRSRLHIESPVHDESAARTENPWRARHWLSHVVLLPTLAAFAAMKVEVFIHATAWMMLVILLISDDGRWIGAFIGAMLLGGRNAFRTGRLVIGSMSAGVTQLALTALAAHAWAIPGEATMALLAGALIIEFTAPMRRRLVEQLNQTEDQFST
jgi:hypothetical protein